MWAKKAGVAIITNAYIANGPHQMTVIPGDAIHVIESTGAWHRGKNMYTGRTGIFPAVCASLVETEDTSFAAFTSHHSDLIFYEASVTLDEALESFLHAKTSQECTKLADRIFDVVTQLDLCMDGESGQGSLAVRATLGASLDNLRLVLNLPKTPRSMCSNMATLSTWGRETLVSNTVKEVRTVKKNEYVLLHVTVDVRTLKKQMICRFLLYDPVSKKFLSCPVSLVSVEGSKYDLLFDQLETRHIQKIPGEEKENNCLYLCIYTYDLLSHREGQYDERKFVSCAVVRLPKSKNHVRGKYFGKCRITEVQSLTGPKAISLEMHKILCAKEIPVELQKKITRAGPSFQVKFTPFFGATEDIVKGQHLKGAQVIPPLALPLQIPIGLKRNMLTVTVGNINIDSHPKKIRVIVRIFDTANRTFMKGMESIMLLSYDNAIWCGPLMSGKRPSPNEVFGIDLNVTDAPLCSLFLVIQIDKAGMAEKKLSPYAYAMIRLSSDIGSLTRELEKTIELYDFKPSGKVVAPGDFPVIPKGNRKKVGTLDYRIEPASTVVTQDENLHQLLTANKATINIEKILSQLMFCGISEWSKFAPEMMMNICQIMVTADEHAQLAFTTLQSMFAEFLSKAGSDYSPLMDEFVRLQFDSEDAEHTNTAKCLCDKMLSAIMNILARPVSDQDFRTCFKTMPYHLHLIGRSYAKAPDDTKQEHIRNLFNKLNEIISHVEEDKVQNSFYMSNQRLLMEHFAAIVDDLPMIFGVKGACEITKKFILSIRTDNEQINKAKMQMLLELVQKNTLWSKEAGTVMREVYTNQINWAFEKADVVQEGEDMKRDDSCSSLTGKNAFEEYISKILMSLFFVNNDDYIISFVSKICSESVNLDRSMLLLICSFLFPAQFPFDELLKVMDCECVSSFELLFVLMHVLTAAKKEVRALLTKTPDLKLFKCALSLAFKSGSRLEDKVDCRLHEYLYSINNNFTVLGELYHVIPISKRTDYDVANQILAVYTCFQSPALIELYYQILRSEINLNKNCDKGKLATLRGLWNIASVPNFRILSGFFTDKSTKALADFSEKYTEAVEAIATLHELEPSRKNEDERAEALIYVLELARSAHDPQMEFVFLKLLVQLNMICQNSLEAAFTLRDILPLIKCDDEPLEEKFLHFEAKCGRELHSEILFEICSLCISSGYEELALPFCNQIIETCVKKFGHIELMPRVMAVKEQIYRNISTTTRTFSSFFRATFYGEGFSKCFRNRTFVYRRVVTAGGTGTFRDEMRHKFSSETVIGTEPPRPDQIASENSRYIQLGSVVPSTEEEAADPFFKPPYKEQPRYISEFEEHNRPKVFRADIVTYESGGQADTGIPKASHVVVHQQFLRVKNTFPFFACRVEVDTPKTTDCLLKPLDNATVAIARKNQQILSDYKWVWHRLEQHRRPDENTISRLSSSINSAIQAGTVGNTKVYAEEFFSEGFIAAHADQEKNIERLKEVLVEQMVYILKSTRVLKDVETRETKDANANTARNFMIMVRMLRQFGVVMDQNKL